MGVVNTAIPEAYRALIPKQLENEEVVWIQRRQCMLFPDQSLIFDPVSDILYDAKEFMQMCEDEDADDEIEVIGNTLLREADADDDDFYTETFSSSAIVDPLPALPKPVGNVYAKGKLTTQEEIFSSGLTVSPTIFVLVHHNILAVCKDIYKGVDKDEFSIVAKGSWFENAWIVTDAYAVPKQEVGYASVDYDLDDLHNLKMQGYNTIIHGHPTSCKQFSRDDMEYINAHFECSVLFCDNQLIVSCLPLKITDNFTYQAETKEISLYYPEEATVDPALIKDKITRKKSSWSGSNYQNAYGRMLNGVWTPWSSIPESTGGKKGKKVGTNKQEDWDHLSDEDYERRIMENWC